MSFFLNIYKVIPIDVINGLEVLINLFDFTNKENGGHNSHSSQYRQYNTGSFFRGLDGHRKSREKEHNCQQVAHNPSYGSLLTVPICSEFAFSFWVVPFVEIDHHSLNGIVMNGLLRDEYLLCG